MKINPLISTDAISKYKMNSVKNDKKVDNVTGVDKLELSEEAKAFLPALKLAKEAGDVRMDKVEAMKKRIESGNYNVDGGDIADSMIKGAHINIKA